MDKIDFVVTWVDGNDINWQNDRNKYNSENSKLKESDNKDIRYRDWGILKYWFRGVEKYAPWVNKIHFITYGHLPDWLDTNNPKLHIVNHKDYIPEEYLPTFNSHTIENNIHRIKELSDYFVLFNDDMFIIDKVKETDFFKNGSPCDSFAENVLTINKENDVFPHILLNNMSVINSNFNKKSVMKKNLHKYINIKYGKKNFRTLALMGWPNYSMIHDSHIPVSLCKKTIEEVWQKEYELLDKTCRDKFRSIDNINQYVFRYWQMLNGNFSPRKFEFGKYMSLKEDNSKLCNTIKEQKYKIICINDSENVDFKKTQRELIESFEVILKNKSSFEK